MNRLWIMNASLTIQFVMMLIYGALVGAALGLMISVTFGIGSTSPFAGLFQLR